MSIRLGMVWRDGPAPGFLSSFGANLCQRDLCRLQPCNMTRPICRCLSVLGIPSGRRPVYNEQGSNYPRDRTVTADAPARSSSTMGAPPTGRRLLVSDWNEAERERAGCSLKLLQRQAQILGFSLEKWRRTPLSAYAARPCHPTDRRMDTRQESCRTPGTLTDTPLQKLPQQRSANGDHGRTEDKSPKQEDNSSARTVQPVYSTFSRLLS